MTLDELIKNKPLKISVQVAASFMGVTPRFLQCSLQQGKFPFGIAVKLGKWMYYINTTRFINYVIDRIEEPTQLYAPVKQINKGKSMQNLRSMSKETLPDILTAQNISDYLKISRRRVYELFQLSPEHGGIPCFEIGASKRVEKEDFLRWINERKS